jgi:PAS domain S-box-containing protein
MPAERPEGPERFDDLALERLFACLPAPAWAFDRETLRILAVSEGALHVYGYTREEFLALTLRELRHPSDVAAMEARVHALPAGSGPVAHSLWRHRRRDGTPIDVDIVSSPIIVGGRPARLVAAQVVTDRERTIEALRRSEASLASAQQRAQIGSWEIDMTTGAPAYSAELYRLLGRDPALGPPDFESFMAMVEPRDAQGLRAHYRRALREGRPVRFAFRLRRADGELRWMEAVSDARPGPPRAGSQARVLSGTLQDVTERHAAEEALRQSEERWKFAIQGAGDAVWDFDVETGEEYCTRRWPEMLGYAADETFDASHQAWADRIHPEDRATVLASVQAHLEGRTPSYRSEYRARCKDGSWKWFAVRGVVVERRPDGRPRRMVGTRSDIDDLKRARSLQQELEEQLRQSQKMESLGTLAGGIAHDFNNILGAMLGHLQLAREEAVAGQPLQSRLEQIERSGRRARELVQQILAFSRKQPQAFLPIALRPLVVDTLVLMRSMLPAAAQLESELADEPLWVEANATQLQQVLMNLATNAWHALEGRPGRIVVRLARAGMEGDGPPPAGLRPAPHARLTVEDSGCGMDAATLLRVFEPFFTTKPVGRGTGLGLAVAHGIVSSHGGAIAIDSVPGRGTTVAIHLPLADAPSAHASEPVPPHRAAANGTGQRILVVDDDEVMALLLGELLARAGYRVATHRDAPSALAALRADPHGYDLVLTDFNMPNGSGLAVAGEVARLRAGLPVVIVSGYVTDELRAEGRRLGVRALLHKECSAETLTATVQRLLAGSPEDAAVGGDAPAARHGSDDRAPADSRGTHAADDGTSA